MLTSMTLTYGNIGKFNVGIQGFTVNDEDMVCLNLVVDFTKGFPRLW